MVVTPATGQETLFELSVIRDFVKGCQGSEADHPCSGVVANIQVKIFRASGSHPRRQMCREYKQEHVYILTNRTVLK